MWNNFDDDSTKMMDSVLAIEHEMAAVVLPDDAVGKHKITERLEVCWIGLLYYISVEKRKLFDMKTVCMLKTYA